MPTCSPIADLARSPVFVRPRLARISQAAPPASPDSAQRPSDEVWVAVSLALQREEEPETFLPDLCDEQPGGGPEGLQSLAKILEHMKPVGALNRLGSGSESSRSIVSSTI